MMRRISTLGLAASMTLVAGCGDTTPDPNVTGTSGGSETSSDPATSTTDADDDSTQTSAAPDLPSSEESETSGTETETGSETETGTETGEPECAPECEDGFMCIDAECVPIMCGDGIASFPEECDDGNEVELDGCEPDCTLTLGAQQIAIANSMSCALQLDGEVVCWGQNEYGQLGQGHTEAIGDDELPNVLGTIDVGGPVSSISASREHVCALRADEQVVCWGNSLNGRLGYGDLNIVGNNEAPADAGPVDVGGPVGQVSAGYYHTCARTTDDELRCWGSNGSGVLGYGHTASIGDDEHPVSAGNVDVGGSVIDVALLAQHTCVLLEDGAVRCWGLNTAALGQGSEVDEPIGDDELPASIATIDLGGPAQALAGGFYHACALLEGGEVVCWGSGDSGQLGYGNYADVGDDEAPASVGFVELGEPAVAIAATFRRSCAIGESGSLYCWGRNEGGLLGYPDVMEPIGGQLVPADVGPVELPGPVDEVALSQSHTCARIGGLVYCWGYSGGGYAYALNEIIGDDEPPASQGPVQFFGGEGNGGIDPEPNDFDGEWDATLTFEMPTADPPVGLEVDTLVRVQGSYWSVFSCEGCTNSFVVRDVEDDSLLAARVGSMNYPLFAPHGGIMAMLGLEAETWLEPIALSMNDADLCPPLLGNCAGSGMRRLADVSESGVPVASVLDSTSVQTSRYLITASRLEEWTNCNTVDTQTRHAVAILPLGCAPDCVVSSVESCEPAQDDLEWVDIGFRPDRRPVDPGYDMTCRVLGRELDEPTRWELELDCVDIP